MNAFFVIVVTIVIMLCMYGDNKHREQCDTLGGTMEYTEDSSMCTKDNRILIRWS